MGGALALACSTGRSTGGEDFVHAFIAWLSVTVTETPLFQRLVVAVWTDEERNEFIAWLSSNPLAGDVIPAAGGLRKVRWSRAGMGKRGGARVIYFNRLASGDMVLLWIYTKAKLDNIRPEFLLTLKEQFNDQND